MTTQNTNKGENKMDLNLNSITKKMAYVKKFNNVGSVKRKFDFPTYAVEFTAAEHPVNYMKYELQNTNYKIEKIGVDTYVFYTGLSKKNNFILTK